MNKKLRITTKAATSALALLLAGSGNALAGNIQPGYYEMEVNCQLNQELDSVFTVLLEPFQGVTTTPCTFTETEDSIRIDGGLFDGLFISQDTLRYYGNEINVSNYNCKLADYDGNELKNGNIILSEKDSVIFVQDFSVFSLPLQNYGVDFPAFFIQGATFKAVDVTPLENALAKAQNYRDSLDSNIYYALIENMDAQIKEYAQTPKTNEAIKQAVASIEEGLSEARTLVKDYENLKFDKLDSMISYANNIIKENNVSTQSLSDLINEAELAKANILSTQTTINTLSNNISKEINNIKERIIKFDELDGYLYKADSLAISIKEEHPDLADSINQVTSYIRINITRQNTTSIDSINDVCEYLNNGVIAYVYESLNGTIVTEEIVDLQQLDSLLVYAEKLRIKAKETGITSVSTDSLDLAIFTAESIITSTNQTQAKIDNAIEMLSSAIKSIESEIEIKTKETEIEIQSKLIDLEELVGTSNKLIEKAKECNLRTIEIQIETEQVVEDTIDYVTLLGAINNANHVIENPTTLEIVNNAITDLTSAIKEVEEQIGNVFYHATINGVDVEMVISEKDNFEDNTLVVVDRMYSDENEKSQNIIFNDGGQYVAKSVLFNDSIGLQVPCDFVAKELTLDRTPYSNLASFILPISVPLDKVNGKVCKFVSFDGETLSFDEVTDDATEPYVPYIVANHDNSEPLFEKMYDVNVYANDCKAIEAGDATHAGTMVAINLTSNPMYQYYAFVGGKFYSVDNLTVPPTRTFITLTKNGSISARPRTLNFSINGEITGIATVSSDAISFGNVTVYDILGRVVRNDVPSTTCLEGLSDGTYVVNGAKYIIRNNKVQAESQVKNNMMAD